MTRQRQLTESHLGVCIAAAEVEACIIVVSSRAIPEDYFGCPLVVVYSIVDLPFVVNKLSCMH